MTEQDGAAGLIREIAYPHGDEVPRHRISVDPEAFGSIFTILPAHRRTGKKLNLRIRKEDNRLLKSLAEPSGLSSSALLNRLLHDLLLEALLAIEEEDARALLARVADERASYDGFERPWCVDVAGRFSAKAIENALKSNQLTAQDVQPPEHGHDPHSDRFHDLVRLLEDKQ